MREIIFCNLEAELSRAKIIKAELAAMIGISAGTLSSKLTGKTEFALDEMEIIKARLEKITGNELTMDYLFERGN